MTYSQQPEQTVIGVNVEITEEMRLLSSTSVMVLDNVSYGFDCGKLYAILGPSGSGKSTLLSLLAGLDIPFKGESRYDGVTVTPKGLIEHRRHHISLVFQSYNLIDYLTPVENVKLGGKGDPGILLDSIGIGLEYRNRSVLQFSGRHHHPYLRLRKASFSKNASAQTEIPFKHRAGTS